MKKQVELTKYTKDYNLNASFRNYIDPECTNRGRTKWGWTESSLYAGTLQRKIEWVYPDSQVNVDDTPVAVKAKK